MVKFLIKVDFLNSRIEFSPNVTVSKEPSKDPDKPIFLLALNENIDENQYPSYAHSSHEIEMDEPFDDEDKFWAGKMDSAGGSGNGSTQIIEKIVEKIVEVPVERIVEKYIEVPVEKIVQVPVQSPQPTYAPPPPQPTYAPPPPQPTYAPPPPQPTYAPEPIQPTASPSAFFGAPPAPVTQPPLDPEAQKYLSMFNRFKEEYKKTEVQLNNREIDKTQYDKKREFMYSKMQEIIPKLKAWGVPFSMN